MAGARPKPTHLKVVSGTARKDRVRADEPTYPDADISDPPPGLSARASAAWGRIAPQLLKAGVLKQIDVDSLRILCDALVTYDDAHKEIEKFGYFTASPNGMTMLSPAVYLRNQAAAQIQKLFTEFGMTPASRTKVGGKVDKKKGDDWDDF